mgnify:CR=1 FL=1|tara:strand:- start:79 stop:330 length:252 start_codon:yes stop_codon:yes gene_type:complete
MVLSFRDCTTMDIDAFRKLSCSECGKDLDVRSYFLPVRIVNIDKFGNENRGMEIHVRCINSDCDKSDYNKNPDYFKPVFVGAI